jgi:hypothetical protein
MRLRPPLSLPAPLAMVGRSGAAWLRIGGGSLLGLIAAPAAAYETDQLTDRDVPLVDVLGPANEKMNEMLSLAVAESNRKTRCVGDDEEQRRSLAHEVYEIVGKDTRVPPRGELPAMGFGAYAAWLETDPTIARRTFSERTDIYGELTVWQNPLLAIFGPCSTFHMGEVLLGADKIDHFLVQGYFYFRKSEGGQDPLTAVAWGTRTERAVWGQSTTGVFSYADLSANYHGFRFYADMLQPDSLFDRREDGCLEKVRDFDGSDWIDWTFDEVQNPPVYNPALQEAVRSTLLNRSDRICRAWKAAPGEGHELPIVLDEPYPYALGPAPARVDPFQLNEVCEDGAADATDPAPPSPRRR